MRQNAVHSLFQSPKMPPILRMESHIFAEHGKVIVRAVCVLHALLQCVV